MITCPNCGLEQEISNFCGGCGTSLKNIIEPPSPLEKKATSVENQKEPTKMNAFENREHLNEPPLSENEEPVEKTAYSRSSVKKHPEGTPESKETLQEYWRYFISCLKEPSKHTQITQFKFALSSTIIALLLWVIVPFWLLNKTFSTIDNFFRYTFSLGSSFDYLGFETFIRMLLLMGIVYVLTFVLTFLLAKSFGTITSWKEAIAKLGAYNAYIITGFVIVLILLLLNSLFLASILLSLLTSLFIFFIPFYVVISTFKEDYKMDKFIRYLITLALFLVLYIIIYFFFFDKFANDL